MDRKIILSNILESIQTKISPQAYKAYFEHINIDSITENSLTINCKSAFVKSIIENRYYETLRDIIRNIFGKNITIEIQVKSNLNDLKNNITNLFSLNESKKEKNQIFEFDKKIKESNLNPKYTFNTFVVGTNNQLAYAAAQAIVNNPGQAYNPLFIYGGVGLGKTHLMQAIGHALISKHNKFKVLYSSTETFLNEMIESIMKKNPQNFRNKYRDLDVFILDDIQFISNKIALQEEFFNTFNTLYQAGKQIIIASDRPPSEISHLESRIRSRFEGGLVVDIQPPDLETRIAIVKNKLNERNEELPQEVIYKIAEIVNTNIRELEGAVFKMIIFSKTNNGVIKPEDVHHIFDDKFKLNNTFRKKIKPNELINIVCDELQIKIKEIKSNKRNQEIAYARHVCMYLLKDVFDIPLIKIASLLGRKDHTTVIHGISKIQKLLENDNQTKELIRIIKNRIQYVQ